MILIPRSRAMGLALLAAGCFVFTGSTVQAEMSNHGDMPADAPALLSMGGTLLEKVQGLVGAWDSPDP